MVALAMAVAMIVLAHGAFDKSQDPMEQQNLAQEEPEVTASLNEMAVGYLESPPPPWGEDAPSVEIDEMQLNQLRALGYGVQ